MITLFGLMKFWAGLGAPAVVPPDCEVDQTTLISDAPTDSITSLGENTDSTTLLAELVENVTLISDAPTDNSTILTNVADNTTMIVENVENTTLISNAATDNTTLLTDFVDNTTELCRA